MPKTTDRRTPPVELTVSTPSEVETTSLVPMPYLPWVATVILGPCAAVLLGWLTVGVVIVAGWLTSTTVPPSIVLDAVNQAWLGIHAVPFELAGAAVSIVPLGLSMLVALAISAVAAYALAQRGPDASWRTSLVVAASCTTSYSLAALLLGSLVGSAQQGAGCFVGAAAISAAGSVLGVTRGGSRHPGRRTPALLRALPRAVRRGLGVLVIASVLTMAVAVLSHWAQITALQTGLAPDAVGTALLIAVYAAYLPNLLLWAGSYALGAGITVGAGTVVTPWRSDLGLLPDIPLVGALPSVPPVYGVLFVATGPVAGAVAALTLRRGLARGGFPAGRLAAAAASASAGLCLGLVWVVASWVSRGGLGTARLAVLGPRFPELVTAGILPIVAGAVVAGLLADVLAGRRLARRTPSAEEPAAEEATRPMPSPD